MAGAASLKQLLLDETAQLEQEGRDIDTAYWRAAIEKAAGDREKLLACRVWRLFRKERILRTRSRRSSV